MHVPAFHRAARPVTKAAFRLPCSPGRFKAITCRAAASTALPDSQAPSASKITGAKVYLRTHWPKVWLHGSVAGGSWKDIPMTPVRLLWLTALWVTVAECPRVVVSVQGTEECATQAGTLSSLITLSPDQ